MIDFKKSTNNQHDVIVYTICSMYVLYLVVKLVVNFLLKL